MRGTHPAAYRNIEPLQNSILNDGDQTQIVREHINVVGGGNGYADLEFSGQIGRAVYGFAFGLVFGIDGGFLAIEPDFTIGPGARQEVGRQLLDRKSTRLHSSHKCEYRI